jgi:hypothetical protein
MTLKSWNVGDVLTASDMNVWTIPIAVIKPSATARNTTTTLADDPDLQLAVAASSSYMVQGVIFYDGASMSSSSDPGGLKWTFSTPAGATGQYFIAHQNASGNFTGSYSAFWSDANQNWTQAATQGVSIANGLCGALTGVLQVAGTAGTLTFRWAQINSSGTNTHVQAQSYLVGQRIS